MSPVFIGALSPSSATPEASTKASAADRIAFQPAMEMPHIAHAVSSQRTILAPNRYFLSCSGESPRGTLPAQACGPAHQ